MIRPGDVTAVAARFSPELLTALRTALAGSGPALLPLPDGEPGRTLLAAARPDRPVADGTALLLPTSGSSGAAKLVELGAAALLASAAATHERLGGPGRWLLALPLTHVAGWQVLVRSVHAGMDPVVLDAAAPFTADAFVAATERLGGGDDLHRRYTALVPTQLRRLLDDADGRAALASFDGVLVGGAATPAGLLALAGEAGVVVRTTYGMTETSGGCVYDHRPLAGVEVAVEPDGRVLLAGPVLAQGYRGDPALTEASFVDDGHGTRWFRTSDRGRIEPHGSLTVLGRLDDVIVTGGVNVSPAAVEQVVADLDGVRGCVVVGVPDPQWGQAVVAVLAAAPGRRPSLDTVRAVVAERLGREAAPRHLLVVDSIPLRGIGKPDRAAARDLATRQLSADR